jgi:hypothetical protein
MRMENVGTSHAENMDDAQASADCDIPINNIPLDDVQQEGIPIDHADVCLFFIVLFQILNFKARRPFHTTSHATPGRSRK